MVQTKCRTSLAVPDIDNLGVALEWLASIKGQDCMLKSIISWSLEFCQPDLRFLQFLRKGVYLISPLESLSGSGSNDVTHHSHRLRTFFVRSFGADHEFISSDSLPFSTIVSTHGGSRRRRPTETTDQTEEETRSLQMGQSTQEN